MDQAGQQNPSTESSPAASGVAPKRLIQPSASFMEELKKEQQATPVQPQTPQQPSSPPAAPAETPIASPSIAPVDASPGWGKNGSQMPIGVSASQMGLNSPQHSINWRTYLKPAIVTGMILVVLIAGYLLYSGLFGYASRTVQANGFTYTVTYSRSASKVTVNGQTYLQGTDKFGHTMLLYVAKSVSNDYDCHTSAGSDLSIVATPQVDGQQHNLCYSPSLNVYGMNFTYNNAWYSLAIFPKVKGQKLNQSSVITVASTVNISS